MSRLPDGLSLFAALVLAQLTFAIDASRADDAPAETQAAGAPQAHSDYIAQFRKIAAKLYDEAASQNRDLAGVFGCSRYPLPQERRLLVEIRQRPVEDRVALLASFVAVADEQGQDNVPLEYVTHAVVGRDPRVRAKVIEEILKPELMRDGVARKKQRALMRIALELGIRDEIPGLRTFACRWMTDERNVPQGERYFEGLPRGYALRSIEPLAKSASPTRREEMLEILLAACERPWQSRQPLELHMAVQGVLEELDDETLARWAPRAVSANVLLHSRAGSSLESRVPRLLELDALAWPHQPIVSRPADANVIRRFIQELDQHPDLKSYLKTRIRNLHFVAGDLPDDKRVGVAQAVRELLLEEDRFPYVYAWCINLLPMMEALSEEQRVEVFRHVSQRAVAGESYHDLAPVVIALADHVPASELRPLALELITLFGKVRPDLAKREAEDLLQLCSKLDAAGAAEIVRQATPSMEAGRLMATRAVARCSERLPETQRRKLHESLLVQFRNRPSAQARAWFAQAMFEGADLGSAAAKTVFDTVMREFLELARPGAEKGGRDNVREPYGHKSAATAALVAIAPRLSDADQALAAKQIRELLATWNASWRTDVLCQTLNVFVGGMSRAEAEESFQVYVRLLVSDDDQHPGTHQFVKDFINRRPIDEREFQLRKLAPEVIGGNAELGGRTVQAICETLPPENAGFLLLELAPLACKDARNPDLLERLAQRVPAKQWPLVAASLSDMLAADQGRPAAVALGRCLEHGAAEMPAEMRWTVVQQILKRLRELSKSFLQPLTAVERFPSVQRTFTSLCGNLKPLIAALGDDQSAAVQDELAKLLGQITHPDGLVPVSRVHDREKAMEHLLDLLADSPTPLSKRSATTFATSLALLYRQIHPTAYPRLAELAERASGEMKPGEAAEFFAKLVSTRGSAHDKSLGLIAIVRFVPKTDVEATLQSVAEECLDVPGLVLVQHVPSVIEALTDRLPLNKTERAMEDWLGRVREETDEFRQLVGKIVLVNLLARSAGKGKETFSKWRGKLMPILTREQQWQATLGALRHIPRDEGVAFATAAAANPKDYGADIPPEDAAVEVARHARFDLKMAFFLEQGEALHLMDPPRPVRIFFSEPSAHLPLETCRQILDAPDCVGKMTIIVRQRIPKQFLEQLAW
jgi:hypothetical protein